MSTALRTTTRTMMTLASSVMKIEGSHWKTTRLCNYPIVPSARKMEQSHSRDLNVILSLKKFHKFLLGQVCVKRTRSDLNSRTFRTLKFRRHLKKASATRSSGRRNRCRPKSQTTSSYDKFASGQRHHQKMQ